MLKLNGPNLRWESPALICFPPSRVDILEEKYFLSQIYVIYEIFSPASAKYFQKNDEIFYYYQCARNISV